MVLNKVSMRASDDSIVTLECHDRLNSTAALAREYAKQGYPDRYAVISEFDHEKGADKRGIYLSCILRPSFFPSQAPLLSALSAVAFVTALEEHTQKRLGIGWVSSVYCEGKAFGKVSIEGKLDSFASYEYIIVNFSAMLSAEDFPPRLTDLIRKVFESENSSIATIIAKTILNRFFPFYSDIKNSTKFMNIYRKKFVLHGVKIKIVSGGKKLTYKVLGINHKDCALLVENKSGKIEKILSNTNVIIPKTVKLPKKSHC